MASSPKDIKDHKGQYRGTQRRHIRRLPAPEPGRAAARRGRAAGVSRPAPAKGLSLRLVPSPRAGLGRERRAGPGRMAAGPDRGGHARPSPRRRPAPTGAMPRRPRRPGSRTRPPGAGTGERFSSTGRVHRPAQVPDQALPQLGRQGRAPARSRCPPSRCSSTSATPPRPS